MLSVNGRVSLLRMHVGCPAAVALQLRHPLSRAPRALQLAFVGLSVVATVRQALKLGNERAAQRVRSEFRLSDKRFWGIKVRRPPPPPGPLAVKEHRVIAGSILMCLQTDLHWKLINTPVVEQAASLSQQTYCTI